MSTSQFKPLVLAGGKSTRMGEPKHLLSMPNGSTLAHHSCDILRQVCPWSKRVYISLAHDSPVWSFRQDTTQVIYDLEKNDTAESAGPAAGLLAAHRADPRATWLVVACDYPLLTPDVLRRLCEAYTAPLTCFRNSYGYCEPLIGVWSPVALAALDNEVARGCKSPTAVVKKLDGLTLSPPPGRVERLFNVNTKEDWYQALKMLDNKVSAGWELSSSASEPED